jgi:hypothetical protein
VASIGRLIQTLILFSTILGIFFLWEVYSLLPSFVFDFLALGWFLFLVDSVLTFVRPRISYFLGLVLAILTLAASIPQPEHYSLIASGNVEATVTLILGSSAQAGIIVSVAYYALKTRRSSGS